MIPPVNRLPAEDQLRPVEHAAHPGKPMLLAIPPGEVQVGTFPDGSTGVVAKLTRDALHTWVRLVGQAAAAGIVEAPTTISMEFSGIEEDVYTITIPEGTPAKQVAQLLDGLVGRVLKGETLSVFVLRLRCGCGVRVEVTS